MDSKDKSNIEDCFLIFAHTLKHIKKSSRKIFGKPVKNEIDFCLINITNALDFIEHSFKDYFKDIQMVNKKKHVGFKKAAASISKKEGVSKESANKILASSSRKASAKAKKANPKLKKVKGK